MRESFEHLYPKSTQPVFTEFRARDVETASSHMYSDEEANEILNDFDERQARKFLVKSVDILRNFLLSFEIDVTCLEEVARLPIYKNASRGATYASPDVILIHPDILGDEQQAVRFLVHEAVHAFTGYSLHYTQNKHGHERIMTTSGFGIIKDETIVDGEQVKLQRSKRLEGFNEGLTDLIARLALIDHYNQQGLNGYQEVTDSTVKPMVDVCKSLIDSIAKHKKVNPTEIFEQWLNRYIESDFLILKDVKAVFGWRGVELVKAMDVGKPAAAKLIKEYFDSETSETRREKIYQTLFSQT